MNKIKTACTRMVAISGSLQSRFSNTAVIQLAAGLADERAHVDVFDALDKLPYFNPDLDILLAPAAVAELRQRLASADAVLIARPEYAHEMPGVLKNALDWLVSSGELYGNQLPSCALRRVLSGAHLCAQHWSER